MDFEDIEIEGINNDESTRRDPASGLFDVVLNLSALPPWEWSEYFNARWKQEFYMMKRHAYASGTGITITCVPSEIETDHLSHLEAVINETNAAYRAHVARAAATQAATNKQEAEDKTTLDELNTRLFKKS